MHHILWTARNIFSASKGAKIVLCLTSRGAVLFSKPCAISARHALPGPLISVSVYMSYHLGLPTKISWPTLICRLVEARGTCSGAECGAIPGLPAGQGADGMLRPQPLYGGCSGRIPRGVRGITGPVCGGP